MSSDETGPFVGSFALPRLERVVSGPGRVAALREELDRYQRHRIVVVTGRTLASSTLLERVVDAAGGRRITLFAGARQHVPSATVRDLVTLVDDVKADCLVSFGGGSPIDTAKAAVHATLTRSGGPATASPDADALVHVAIPTTLSAGEFTAIAGITDESSLVKRGVFDARLAPRAVITDPALTLDTPDWLWAATGVRALDHAVESIYSIRHHPFSDALASRAIGLLVEHLPPSIHADGGEKLAHRGRCQIAAWLAVFGLTNVGFGLSHAFGHQIGPRWNVPHGVTSCIMLPHVMRYMADLCPGRFGPIAGGFGVPFDAAEPRGAAIACAGRAAAFVARLGLPSRLRDAGVPRDALGGVVGIVRGAMEEARAVERPVAGEELLAILESAY